MSEPLTDAEAHIASGLWSYFDDQWLAAGPVSLPEGWSYLAVDGYFGGPDGSAYTLDVEITVTAKLTAQPAVDHA